MIDYECLHRKIRESKKTFIEIAKECDISRDALYTKVNGERDFKLQEFVKLCNCINAEMKELLIIITAQ